MAIVLLILALMLGGILMPISEQVEQRKVSEVNKQLEEVKEALIGFAIANGRLPRPATSAVNGAENAALCLTDAACTGFIPWQALGLQQNIDPWAKLIRYSVSPAFANAAITVTTAPTKAIRTRNNAGALLFLAGAAGACPAGGLPAGSTCVPAVVWSHGKNNYGTSAQGNALADISGTNADEDGNNTGTFAGCAGAVAGTCYMTRTVMANTAFPGGEFDDVAVWLSPNILFNRMIAAGKTL
jgi:type II secretory pathway pseudopilin PulG